MNSDTSLESAHGRALHYLCQQVVREGQGGYAHVTEIIGGLAERGWNVRLFQPGYHRRAKRLPLLCRLPGMIGTELRLISTHPRPAAVYIRSHFISNLVAWWCVHKRIPYVEEVNGSGTDAGKVYPILRAMRQINHRASAWRWRHAGAIITVTPALREHVLQTAPGAIVEVIPTGANVGLFRGRGDEPAPVDGPYVIFSGSLAPWHDINTMLAAVELPQWPSDVRLVVLGSGRQEAAAQEAGLRTVRVLARPAVPYREVPVWVNHAVAALSLLRTAGGLSPSPLKLYEAMACAVPVIASEAPGQADLVRTTQCGIVIPEANPAALASAVAALRAHPEESAMMGQRGRTAVVSSHSWDARAEQTHRLLLRVVGGVSTVAGDR